MIANRPKINVILPFINNISDNVIESFVFFYNLLNNIKKITIFVTTIKTQRKEAHFEE